MDSLSTPYRDLLPPLSTDEFEALKASIERDGVRDPILVDEVGNILDGHHRHKIKPDAPSKIIAGLSEGQKQAFVLASNFQRRNLSPEQKSELRARQISIARTLRDEGDAQENIAIRLGVSQQTVSAWLIHNTNVGNAYNADNRVKVTKDEQAAIFERVGAGEAQDQIAADFGISQPHVSRVAKKEQNERDRAKVREEAETLAAETGKYQVVVIDPPWDMEKIERDVAPNQTGFDYPTMSLDQISAFEIPAADDCHIFLWTTHKYLPAAFDILKAWGTKYVCTFVWHKAGGFQPYNLPQFNCEFALYARKGAPKFASTKEFKVCFTAPRREHGRKPDEFYDMVRRVTGGLRTDIFSREERDGFVCWGAEKGKFARD